MSSRHEFISTFGFARGMWIHEEHSGGITYHIINENHYDDVEEDRSGPFLSSLSYRIFIHCTTNTHLGFVLFRWLNGLVLFLDNRITGSPKGQNSEQYTYLY